MSSLLTPRDIEHSTFEYFKTVDNMDDTFTGAHTRSRDHFEKLHCREGRTYLPPLSEVADQDSIYSQDSACVVYTSQLRTVANPTPKSALTFAAIWDPDNGMSTFSGKQLAGQEGSSGHPEENEHSAWGDDNNAYLSSFYYDSEHPDCEPHLASRFSTTTTSTSNYIDVDFNEQDQLNFSSSIEDDLLPGDFHPAWVPQIFSVGYTKPPSYGPKRPEISEPFQLTPMTRRDELETPTRQNTLPSRLPSSAKPSSSSLSLFSLSRSYSSASSHTTSRTESTHSSPTSSLRRGFSFGSHRHHSRSQSSLTPATSVSSVDEDMDTSSPDGLDDAPISFRPHTPTRRPSMSSMFGKRKSPNSKKGSEAWVMVDVEVRPTIHQRVVDDEEP